VPEKCAYTVALAKVASKNMMNHYRSGGLHKALTFYTLSDRIHHKLIWRAAQAC
jgi:hypothetical protein